MEFTQGWDCLDKTHSRSATNRKLSCTSNFCFQAPRGVHHIHHQVREDSLWILDFAVIQTILNTQENAPPPVQTDASSAATSQGLWPIELNIWRKNYWYDWQRNTEQTHWMSYPWHFASAVISTPFTCECSNQRRRMVTAAPSIVGNGWGVKINQTWGPAVI